MAEPLPLAEIEARLMLLPPISRGAHLAGPQLHAERLIELWKADGEVALAEAFRLLDVEAVAEVILRTVTAGDCDEGDPRHWHFPPFAGLLPPLREAAWQEILAGKLVLEAIKGVPGGGTIRSCRLCCLGSHPIGNCHGSPAMAATNISRFGSLPCRRPISPDHGGRKSRRPMRSQRSQRKSPKPIPAGCAAVVCEVLGRAQGPARIERDAETGARGTQKTCAAPARQARLSLAGANRRVKSPTLFGW